jgi:hypothetical protein
MIALNIIQNYNLSQLMPTGTWVRGSIVMR